jgi:hypothetical protein
MPKGRRTAPPPARPSPPANAAEGAVRVRELTVKMLDRQDGEGVNWCFMAEILFKAAFDVLDRLPNDDPLKRKYVLAKRVHEGAYNRMVGNETEGFQAGSAGPGRGEPSPGADIGSPRPRASR